MFTVTHVSFIHARRTRNGWFREIRVIGRAEKVNQALLVMNCFDELRVCHSAHCNLLKRCNADLLQSALLGEQLLLSVFIDSVCLSVYVCVLLSIAATFLPLIELREL